MAMAPRLKTVQSQEVLNVSRGYRSSPRGVEETQEHPAGSHATSRVEDSYSEATAAPLPLGGPVRPPAAEELSEDELYYATPQKPQAAKKISQRVGAPNEIPRDDPGGRSQQQSHSASARAISTKPTQRFEDTDADAAQPPGSHRTPSNLQSVAQQALGEESCPPVETSGGLTTRDVVPTSSDESTTVRRAEVTSQTSAMPTPGVGQVGSLALLRQRREDAERAKTRLRAEPSTKQKSLSMLADVTRDGKSSTLNKQSTESSNKKSDAASARPQAARYSKIPDREGMPAAETQAAAGKQNLRRSMLPETAAPKNEAAADSRKRKGLGNGDRLADKPSRIAATDGSRSKSRAARFVEEDEAVGGDEYQVPVSSSPDKLQVPGIQLGTKATRSKPKPAPSKEPNQVTPGKLSKISQTNAQPIVTTAITSRQGVAQSSSELEHAKFSEENDAGDNSASTDEPERAEGLRRLRQPRAPRCKDKKAGRTNEPQHKLPDKTQPHAVQTNGEPLQDFGGAQNNPQVISDGPIASSPLSHHDGTNRAEDETLQHAPDAPEQRLLASKPQLETLGNLRSSPPVAARSTPGVRAGRLEETTIRSHKATVISFGKAGPLNQGTIGENTPGALSARSQRYETRSSMAPVMIRLAGGKTPGSRSLMEARRPKGPSSVATSARTGRSTRKAEPSNVAANVGDALENLFGGHDESQDRRGTTAVVAPTDNTKEPPLTSRKENALPDAICQPLDDDSFINIDHDVPSTPAPEPRVFNAAAPHGQPPNKANNMSKYFAKDEKYNKGREVIPAQKSNTVIEEPKQATKNPRSQAMKSMTSPKKKVNPRAPTKSSRKRKPDILMSRYQDGSDDENLVEPTMQDRHPGVEVKDRLPKTHDLMPPPGAPKATSKAAPAAGAEHVPKVVEKTAASRRPKRGVPEEQSMEPAKKRTKMNYPTAADSDRENHAPTAKTRGLQNRASDSIIRPSDVPAAKVHRVSRKGTQASQTVDVYGSPVPRDMNVMGRETVLENFSQRAPLSPDHVLDGDPRISSQEETPQRDSRIAGESAHFVVPVPFQSLDLSSNTKPIPAAPQASTNAMAHVRVTEAKSRQLHERYDSASNMDNPFASSREPSQSRSQSQDTSSGPLSGFQKRLQKQVGKDRSQATVGTSRVDKRPKLVANAQKQNEKIISKARSPATTKPLGGMLDRQMEKLRERTRAVRAEEDDPEKTLVERDDSLYGEIEVPDAVLPKSSPPVSLSPRSDADFEEFMAWIRGLKPHQLSVFDTLVQCAQRLTVQLVKQENATDQILTDYHRRTALLIENENKKQTQRFQEKQSEVQRKLRESRKYMEKQRKHVERMDREWEAQKQDRMNRKAEEVAANRELEQYINEVW